MPRTQLNKVCLICGNNKPLAAFLEMTSRQGTTYGNVCSSCRGPDAKLNEKRSMDDEDTTSSGLSIDSTARNLAEMQEAKSQKERKESKIEDALKREKLIDEKETNKIKKEKAEKDHRQNFIELKNKQSFLNFQDKKSTTAEHLSKIKKTTETRQHIEQHEKVAEAEIKTEAIKEEVRVNTPDLSGSNVQLGKRAFQTNNFNSYLDFLGRSTPVMRRLEQIGKLANKNPSAAKQAKPPKKEEAPIDYVNKSFPSSRKR